MGTTQGLARIGGEEWVKGQWKHGFMEFIHTVNRLCEEDGIDAIFGEPTYLGDWWVSGYYVEEYPRARVVFPKDKPRRVDEGYRIVATDAALYDLWNTAMREVEQRIEVRPGGDTKGCSCEACAARNAELEELNGSLTW